MVVKDFVSGCLLDVFSRLRMRILSFWLFASTEMGLCLKTGSPVLHISLGSSFSHGSR